MAVKVALSKNEYGLLKEVSCFAESGIPFGVSLDGMSSDMLENTLSLAGKGCLHLKPSRGIWGGKLLGWWLELTSTGREALDTMAARCKE